MSNSKSNDTKAIWSNTLETINADKMALFVYFQSFAKAPSSVPDIFLSTVCETALEVSPGARDSLLPAVEMN